MIGWSRRASAAMLTGWLAMVGLVCIVQVAAAQEPIAESRPRFDVSIGTWISTGDTRWAHDASSVPGLGNPTSKLVYRDVGTNVVELTGKAWLNQRWFGRVNGGFGQVGGGRLVDEDFVSIGGQQLISQTTSNLPDDSMYYINADIGARVLEFRNHRGYVEIFGGYQYWHTKFTAQGIGEQVCNPTFLTCGVASEPAMRPVISNTTNWHSFRIGTSSEYRLTTRLSVLGTVAFSPVSLLDNNDIHHLRTSGPSALAQDPSISMSGYSIGTNADISARFAIARGFFVNVGYRVWWNKALDGDVTFNSLSGVSSTHPLVEFQSLRHGLTAGLSYTF
jgi:outer membrane protease